MSKSPVTDYQVLSAIYKRYSDVYEREVSKENTDSQVYLPIDLFAVSQDLRMPVDMLFGRLYYHLDRKHGYSNDDGIKVPLYTPVAGQQRDCVNFPLLAAVLASLHDDDRKHRWSIGLALASLILSVISLAMSIG